MAEHTLFNFWHHKKAITPIRQTEAAECGLACMAMIANFYGCETSLLALRKRFSISLKGSTLSDIMGIATQLHFISRPLKLDLNEITELKCPCILHWDLNHFVVLLKVKNNTVTILDPAIGKRVLNLDEVSQHFTGIALELSKDKDFEPIKDKVVFKFSSLFKGIRGLKTNLLALFSLACLVEILGILNPFLMQWILDKVVPFNDMNLLSLLILGFFIVLIINTLLSFLQSWVALFFSKNLKLDLESSIFNRLIHLPLTYFQKRHLGDIVSRFQSIHNIQTLFTAQFITAFLDGIFAIFTAILMLMYSIKLSLIVFASIGLYLIIRYFYYAPLKELSQEEMIVAAKKDTYFLETIRGIRGVQFFNKQSYRMTQWLNTYVKEVNISLKSEKLGIFFKASNTLFLGAENLLILWLGTESILEGSFTVGVFIAFIAYKEQFKTKMNSLIENYIKYKLLDVSKERLSDILLAETDGTENKETFDLALIQDNSVDIQNVSFRYDQNEKFILENLNIHIDAKEFVVITGPSGRGKSTLINLLSGINAPTTGDILVGGKSILKYKLPNRLISMVSQDDALYAGSILENICFFDQAADLQWVEQCAKMACIHEEIMRMPMGYETLVGDMGTVLSGGQKQRLFIARALYFRPQILLLDEATSHLDAQNEMQINAVLKQIPITRIAIAHRLETIQAADRIIEL